MITHNSLSRFRGRWGWVSLLVATALLCAPLVSVAAEIMPELHLGREGLWDARSEYDPGRSELVWPRSSEPCLLIDTLDLIRIGYGPGDAGGLLTIGDTDQDSLWELLIPLSYGYSRIYENDGYDNYALQETYPHFIPWDSGDADGDGLPDMVVQCTYYAQLWESTTPHSHPSQVVWQSPYISNVFQQQRIVDLDQDGKNEILLNRDGFGGGGDVVIFECTGDNSFEYVYGSHVTGQNLGWFAVGDFDQDGWTEFAVGDTHGRVFVYECTGDDSYHQVAMLYTDVWNSYYAVEAHDMDGNDCWEFVVGGDIDGSWCGNKWTIFEAIGNNIYTVIDSVKIINGRHGHARCDVGDVDGDDADELVVKNARDMQVYKAINVGTYVPVAYYLQPSDTLLAGVYAHDLNCNGYDEIVWVGLGSAEPTLILEDRRAYGYFELGIATNGTIIPQGGTLSYDGMLVNLETTPETVDVWTEVLLPGGEPFGGNPVLGPIRVTLAPNDTVFAHPSHHIPMAAPPGEYTYMGFVSSSYPLPILASDTLFFTVVEP
ncbi:hypothetical protein AMJ39_04785 [candidate division TA06 bacterium DG_24]|uniref:VCBS repeat-containing protein n=1 Tax=candidate division TA06 bacterium DG_24 TaxID=1703770 RepID=A0A0S7WT67_UNCT6|nr:MAG: hypothetical protein AMJ39_04785 [candidate division TA06 bacterium DG_24]